MDNHTIIIFLNKDTLYLIRERERERMPHVAFLCGGTRVYVHLSMSMYHCSYFFDGIT